MTTDAAGNAGAFADRLARAVLEKQSQVCVGLDPRLELMPAALVEARAGRSTSSPPSAPGRPEGQAHDRHPVAELFVEFGERIIEAVAPYAVAVKLQLACFERYGAEGIAACQELSRYAAQAGLIVIADAKRGDIDVSAQGYAAAFLGSAAGRAGKQEGMGADAVTVNPFYGSDGMKPFLDACRRYGKGIFVLVRTSNPGAAEIQDLELAAGKREGGDGPRLLWERLAELVAAWGEGLVGEEGYSSVGAVVGATDPGAVARARRLLPRAFLLLPGYGAQGAGAADVAAAFDQRGLGALVTASRSIIYAGAGGDFAGAAREAARRMREELWRAAAGE